MSQIETSPEQARPVASIALLQVIQNEACVVDPETQALPHAPEARCECLVGRRVEEPIRFGSGRMIETHDDVPVTRKLFDLTRTFIATRRRRKQEDRVLAVCGR